MLEQIGLTTLIANVGFPIVMVFYMIFRFEKKIDDNTKAINSLIDFLNGKKRRR